MCLDSSHSCLSNDSDCKWIWWSLGNCQHRKILLKSIFNYSGARKSIGDVIKIIALHIVHSKDVRRNTILYKNYFWEYFPCRNPSSLKCKWCLKQRQKLFVIFENFTFFAFLNNKVFSLLIFFSIMYLYMVKLKRIQIINVKGREKQFEA